MIKGFKEFIMRGNVLDLAVAVVIGAAFTAVVNSVVTNVINPLISAVFDAKSLDKALVVSIPTVSGGTSDVAFGAFVGALINFLIVAVVVYFVFVVPVNHFKKRAAQRREAGLVPEDSAVTELDLLTEIRDLLAADQTPAAGKHQE
jgi:large conductance mechanosensitive channel